MENEIIYHKQYLSALIKKSAKEEPETFFFLILVMFFMQENGHSVCFVVVFPLRTDLPSLMLVCDDEQHV